MDEAAMRRVQYELECRGGGMFMHSPIRAASRLGVLEP